MVKLNRQSLEHYNWGAGCEGWHLIQQPNMSVIRERMPPGTSETRHFHRGIRQYFHILAGELLLEIEREPYLLGAGNGMEVAPGQIHQAQNIGTGPVEFLVISDGMSRTDRVDQ